MKNNKLLTSLFVLGMGLSLVACGASWYYVKKKDS